MRIVPYALKRYYINGDKIEDTIRNHTDIYDFCLRLKTNSKSKPFFTYYDRETQQFVRQPLDRTTRYYISKGGGTLTKDFSKEESSGKETGVNVGYTATLFNKYVKKEMKDYNIDYSFYITEAYKIKNVIDDGQLSLFDF